jgi:hypothetical protein
MITCVNFEMDRQKWEQTHFAEEPLDTDLAADEILVEILRLSLTHNSPGYMMNGDTMGFWKSNAARGETPSTTFTRESSLETSILPKPTFCRLRTKKGGLFTVPAEMGHGEGRVPAMNGAAHFQKMIDALQRC